MNTIPRKWVLSWLIPLLVVAVSCNEDLTEVYEGTTLLYSSSFEAAGDTIGWAYTYPWGRRYNEGAPGQGQYSLRVYDDTRIPTATYTLPWVNDNSTVLVNFHARNVGNGVGMCRVRVVSQLPTVEQYILDTTWTEYSISGVFDSGGDLKVELFGSVGGEGTVMFDAISVFIVDVH